MALLTRACVLLISGLNLIWARIIREIRATHWRRLRRIQPALCLEQQAEGNNMLSAAAEGRDAGGWEVTAGS